MAGFVPIAAVSTSSGMGTGKTGRRSSFAGTAESLSFPRLTLRSKVPGSHPRCGTSSWSACRRTGREGSIEDLESGLGGRISAGSTLCTDASPSQRKFGKEFGFDVVQIKGGKGKKGIYNIQHVNNYHSQMKSFFLSFKGVSSKYVNNYLTWFNAEYLNSEAQAVEIFRQAILSEDNSWTTRNLSLRLPVPRNPQKEQRAENRIRRRSKNNQGTKWWQICK